MNIDFPFHFDSRGRTASTSDEDHIRDMIEQVLFTGPGERVNRPDFGTGLMQLVFAPNSDELAATLTVVPGIGPRMARRLVAAGVRHIEDLDAVRSFARGVSVVTSPLDLRYSRGGTRPALQ